MTCAETQFRTRVKGKLGWTVTLGRAANITKPLNGRAACHYCGPCEQGCVTHSYFNAAFTTVADAMKTGKTTLITNAMVYKVLTDPGTKATGLLYIDRVTREGAKSAAGWCCSARRRWSRPASCFNRNGGRPRQLERRARALPDGPHVGRGRRERRVSRRARASRRSARRGAERALHHPVPQHDKAAREEVPARLRLPGRRLDQLQLERARLRRGVQEGLARSAASIRLAGFGEVLPRFDNFVEIDPKVVDTFGIPVLRIPMTWGENEKAMIADMAVTAAQMLEAAGAQEHPAIHDARPHARVRHPRDRDGAHGRDPKTSVLNQFLQTHDIANLFVMDGSASSPAPARIRP